MAIAPGVCEELAFRGFILNGFARSARPSVAIVLSSIAFGVVHMVPQQVFNATLVGLVLGLIAIRSRSLIPGVLFHALYNGSEVLRSRAGTTLAQTPVVNWFVTVVSKDSQPAGIEYSPLALVVGIVVSALLIGWLVLERRRERVFSEAVESRVSHGPESQPRKPDPVSMK
jgi:sodium transport system permease protein